MQENNLNKLEEEFSKYVLPQVDTSIDYNESKLQNQHKKEHGRHSIFLQVGFKSSIASLRLKQHIFKIYYQSAKSNTYPK